MDLIHYSHKENEMKTDGGVMTNETKKYAETYGGMAGAVLPLIIMMGTMIFMVAFGMRSTKNFWSAGYFAVLAGFLVYKDKKLMYAVFFFYKQKTAYEVKYGLVGSEMVIRDSCISYG